MDKVRIGIIGCGGIANNKHMPSLKKVEQAEMVAFCDIIEERAQKAAKEYGVPGAKVYTDYRELLKDKSIDVVHVLTPNRDHSYITVDALEAGKHVMCEKPMAINTAEAQKMIDAAKRTGKKLTIGYQNRFRPDSRYLKQVCEAGDLGEIYYAARTGDPPPRRAHLGRVPGRGKAGRRPPDRHRHPRARPDAVDDEQLRAARWSWAPSTTSLRPHANSANAWGPWDPEKFTVEDSAFGFVRMKNGATIYLESSWALNTLDVHEAKTILCGDKGGADMMGEGGALRINGERFGKTYVTEPGLGAGGVAFYDGETDCHAADLEAKMWIAHVLDDNASPSSPSRSRPSS